MSSWFQPIINLLDAELLQPKLPIETQFDGVYLRNHPILLHFITISKINQLPASYFQEKSNETEKLGLKCIHIWEDIYVKNQNLVNARILALIGIRQRVHARLTIGKRIDKQAADNFLTQHHLQQTVVAYYKFGLYHHDELLAVATFSKSRIMTDGIVPYRSYELIRFASKTGYTVTGGLGKLLHLFIKEVNPAHIMTYADRDWSNGEGYTTLNFELKAATAPQQFYLNTQTLERISMQEGILKPNENRITITNAGSLKFILDRRT
jgi:hypothetical protein